jgi:G3E family GTPase
VPNKIPVTILTGFLGSGKTTLLRRLISENTDGTRIAIVENEFSDESIDNDLLVVGSQEVIVETINGCICCKVRADLSRVLTELHQRRSDGVLAFDRVVIETTGLADPAPVAQTFFVDENVASGYMLDAIVTVVDALHAEDNLDRHVEMQEQIGIADRLIITKGDLVDQQRIVSLQSRLRLMNPVAPMIFGATMGGELPPLFDLRSFNLDAALAVDPEFLGDHEHEHDDEISSVVFKTMIPIDRIKLANYLATLLSECASDLLRYKGVIKLQDDPRRVVLQGVHMVNSLDFGRIWDSSESAETRLVFIGRNLDRTKILRGLEGCIREGKSLAVA